jgi:hypothetical protein
MTLANGTQIVDALTKIGGSSAEELRAPYRKTAAEQARDASANEMGSVGAGNGTTASLNWGRSGEVTAQAAVPPKPSGSGAQRNENESWNMEKIAAATPINQYRR